MGSLLLLYKSFSEGEGIIDIDKIWPWWHNVLSINNWESVQNKHIWPIWRSSQFKLDRIGHAPGQACILSLLEAPMSFMVAYQGVSYNYIIRLKNW